MKSILRLVLIHIVLLTVLPVPATAVLRIQITEGEQRPIPIAIVPFALEEGTPSPRTRIGEIVNDNLRRSGKFDSMPRNDLISRPAKAEDILFDEWRDAGVDNIVVGTLAQADDGRYRVRYQLTDVYTGLSLLDEQYFVQPDGMRRLAHQISDKIYETLTGSRGIFQTQIAYVQVDERPNGADTYKLMLADVSGESRQAILESDHAIMSPAWSPDGKRLAYVSFQTEGRSAIYVQDLASGRQRRVSFHEGINSAPAWSPDGTQLALTLSKEGTPDIYIYDLETERLRRMTRSSAIDTEPEWSPEGDEIYFTSDRGGPPQVYKISTSSLAGFARRVTFHGSYNARPKLTRDGRHLATVYRDERGYRIAVLNLETDEVRVLTDGHLDEAPSFAPNGEVIVYSRKRGDSAQLATVSIYGRANMPLPLGNSRVQDAAWSPYRLD